jgi:pyruvate,orthophosphate dikinase
MTVKKWVYQFNELDAAEQYVGGQWEAVRELFGGKGANLAEMTRIGLPVPPGFTVTTEACNAYLDAGGVFPEAFGDADNPLLVSCRSGAKFSMPGMMDTVLNIGSERRDRQGHGALTGDEPGSFTMPIAAWSRCSAAWSWDCGRLFLKK